VVVLAVSTDPADLQRRFADELSAEFRFLPDTARNLAVLYRGANSAGELTVRQSVLIDRDGVVRWIDRDINIVAHGRDVLAKLRDLRLSE
jgi:peroxiredoxin